MCFAEDISKLKNHEKSADFRGFLTVLFCDLCGVLPVAPAPWLQLNQIQQKLSDKDYLA
jgi:hypothetical protein